MFVAVNQPPEATLPDLLEYLKEVINWNIFGIFLLPNHISKIEDIEETNKNAAQCKLRLFQLYMQVGNRSWRTVAEALRKADYPHIAERIENKFLS